MGLLGHGESVSHGIAQGQPGRLQEVLGGAYGLPCCVPESPEQGYSVGILEMG